MSEANIEVNVEVPGYAGKRARVRVSQGTLTNEDFGYLVADAVTTVAYRVAAELSAQLRRR